jgi:hypothetical protein
MFMYIYYIILTIFYKYLRIGSLTQVIPYPLDGLFATGNTERRGHVS